MEAPPLAAGLRQRNAASSPQVLTYLDTSKNDHDKAERDAALHKVGPEQQ
jgi:hypothetical protein